MLNALALLVPCRPQSSLEQARQAVAPFLSSEGLLPYKALVPLTSPLWSSSLWAVR